MGASGMNEPRSVIPLSAAAAAAFRGCFDRYGPADDTEAKMAVCGVVPVEEGGGGTRACVSVPPAPPPSPERP